MGLKLKIVLVTTAHPSLNPRLVKEADALSQAGYHVTVLYQYWNDWATALDRHLISGKKWNAIRVGGNPVTGKLTYWTSRLFHKAGQKLVRLFGFGNNLAELAIGRCTIPLIKKTKTIPADLYIAHNLAALPAAVIAARKNRSKSGFDAEDLHRYEMSNEDNNEDVQLKKYIEEKYFPRVDYLTASSPQIAKRYEEIFPSLKFTTILNVFPKHDIQTGISSGKTLKLFWFSQHVGLSRGIQDVLGAIRLLENEDIEFHILGLLKPDIKNTLDGIIKNLNFTSPPKITFHPPISPDALVEFASHFDIGLATEPDFSINNDSALSNKIFTYVQSGLAIIASDTTAQKQFINDFPGMGFSYEKKNVTDLAAVIKKYIADKELLLSHKSQSGAYATTVLNWEVEKEKFLSIVKLTCNA